MKRIILIIFLLVLVFGGLFVYQKYNQVFSANVLDELQSSTLLIPNESSFEDVVSTLTGRFIKDDNSFRWVAQQMKYNDGNIKPGRYKIKAGINNRELIGQLRSGRQEPLKVTIRAVRNIEQLAGLVTKKLECDSLTFLNYLNDVYIPSSDYSKETALSLFIPNTYEFYWNTDPKTFLKKMEKEHGRFWNADRIKKAENHSLTPKEVYSLASIVEKESQLKSERPRIAGLYLNRLERGIALQADPTVIFALNDFSIRRVLNKHLEFDNPYNTYKYPGIPPGPIYMPTINAIDAVLDAEEHNYIYFCAKPESGGQHAFASTHQGHLRNARVYHDWANRNGIR